MEFSAALPYTTRCMVLVQFFFEVLGGMLLLSEQQCIMRALTSMDPPTLAKNTRVAHDLDRCSHISVLLVKVARSLQALM